MSDSTVHVAVDNRARLVMAALSASDWPQLEQGQAPHAVHQHSKQTRQQMKPFADHPAVTLLNQSLADGVSLADLFSAAMRCRWPGFDPVEPLPASLNDSGWAAALPQLYADAGLEAFWRHHADFWDEAESELSEVFEGSRLIPFLTQLMDRPLAQQITVIPCIVYPMLAPVLASAEGSLHLILPPAKAWGESPPWPFGEDPGWIVAQSCWALSELFMKENLARLDGTQQALLRHAAVTLCLEQEFDEAEAMAYLVRSKKEHSLPRLPLVVEMLREYLEQPEGRSLSDLAL